MRALVVVALLACLVACTSGPAGPSPVSPEAPPSPTEGPLAGHWVGLTAEGGGLITTATIRDDYCINRYDWEGMLSHQGTKLTGRMTSRFAGADCLSGGRAYHIPAAVGDAPVTNFLELSVTPSGAVSVPWGLWVATIGGAAVEVNHDLTGSYTTNTITLAGDRAERDSSWSMTFGLRRQ